MKNLSFTVIKKEEILHGILDNDRTDLWNYNNISFSFQPFHSKDYEYRNGK